MEWKLHGMEYNANKTKRLLYCNEEKVKTSLLYCYLGAISPKHLTTRGLPLQVMDPVFVETPLLLPTWIIIVTVSDSNRYAHGQRKGGRGLRPLGSKIPSNKFNNMIFMSCSAIGRDIVRKQTFWIQHGGELVVVEPLLAKINFVTKVPWNIIVIKPRARGLLVSYTE